MAEERRRRRRYCSVGNPRQRRCRQHYSLQYHRQQLLAFIVVVVVVPSTIVVAAAFMTLKTSSSSTKSTRSETTNFFVDEFVRNNLISEYCCQRVRIVNPHCRRYHAHHHHSCLCMTVSDDDDVPSSRRSSSRTNKRKNETQTKGRIKQQPKEKNVVINSLLTDIGLQPVAATNRQRQDNQTKKEMTTMKKKKLVVEGDIDGIDVIDIDIKTQLDYSRNGHAVLRGFLDPEQYELHELRSTLLEYAQKEELLAWQQKVEVASASSSSLSSPLSTTSYKTVEECKEQLQKLLGTSTASSLPFLQYFNVWRKINAVENIILYDHPQHRLAKAAAILLDVPSVRLYQDAIFWKRPHDGPTPWHVDARMAPFDTQHMITFWIPLQSIPKNGSGLTFCSKSHSDFALPYWNPQDQRPDSEDTTWNAWDHLNERYPKKLVDYMPFKLGDVSVHSGWTLHCSNGGSDDGDEMKDRVALAVTFVDSDAKIRSDWEVTGDNEDLWSYKDWCQEVEPRRKFRHDLVPIVFPPEAFDY